MKHKIFTFQQNTLGRDFVVGDIHGSYDMVLAALKEATFDDTCDRLFCVGDLVDRGDGSIRALRFLEQPYVHSVLGNHEAMFLEMYADGTPDESVLRVMTRRNGMGWWMDVAPKDRSKLLAAFRKLPLVIEITTSRGTVGLLHAEVPLGMGWAQFKLGVTAGDSRVIDSALWGRTRIEKGDATGVQGVGRIYSGHTPQWNGLRRLGNIYLLDTGAVFRDIGRKDDGRLTLVNAAADTNDLLQEIPWKLVDVRIGLIPATPFGTSLIKC